MPSEDKTNFRELVEKMIDNCSDKTPMVLKCKYMLEIYDDPWKDKRLLKILKANPDLTPEEGTYIRTHVYV